MATRDPFCSTRPVPGQSPEPVLGAECVIQPLAPEGQLQMAQKPQRVRRLRTSPEPSATDSWGRAKHVSRRGPRRSGYRKAPRRGPALSWVAGGARISVRFSHGPHDTVLMTRRSNRSFSSLAGNLQSPRRDPAPLKKIANSAQDA